MAVAVAAPRTITAEEQALARDLLMRARSAMREVESYDQDAVDRLCRAVAWARSMSLVNTEAFRP